MRSRLVVAAIVALLLGGTGVALAAARSTHRPRHSHSSSEVIRTFALTVQTADIDVGDTGPSLGDEFVFSDDLSRHKGGKTIGIDGGVCTLVRIDQSAGTFTQQCVVSATLPGGQITVQGLATFSEADETPTFTLPVTGGSGRYKDAGGQVRVEELSETEANLTVLVLHLR